MVQHIHHHCVLVLSGTIEREPFFFWGVSLGGDENNRHWGSKLGQSQQTDREWAFAPQLPQIIDPIRGRRSVDLETGWGRAGLTGGELPHTSHRRIHPDPAVDSPKTQLHLDLFTPPTTNSPAWSDLDLDIYFRRLRRLLFTEDALFRRLPQTQPSFFLTFPHRRAELPVFGSPTISRPESKAAQAAATTLNLFPSHSRYLFMPIAARRLRLLPPCNTSPNTPSSPVVAALAPPLQHPLNPNSSSPLPL